MQNITEAIEEVNLIKKVIDRTQNDFSKIANFFVAIGVMNAVTYLVYGIMFQVFKEMEQVGYTAWMLFRGLNDITVIGYAVLFVIYRGKLKSRKNDLSLSLINIWGALLIGGKAIRIFFSIIDYREQGLYFYQKTLAFLFPLIGCLVLGFVIQDKLVQWASFAAVILYMIFAGTGFGIRMDSFHGSDVNLGLDMILTGCLLSVGMMLLGIYLKRKGER